MGGSLFFDNWRRNGGDWAFSGLMTRPPDRGTVPTTPTGFSCAAHVLPNVRCPSALPALDCARRVRLLALRHVVLSLFSCRERLVPPPCGDPRLRGRAWRARGLDAGATRDDRNDGFCFFEREARRATTRERGAGDARAPRAMRRGGTLGGFISRDAARLCPRNRLSPTPRPRSTDPLG